MEPLDPQGVSTGVGQDEARNRMEALRDLARRQEEADSVGKIAEKSGQPYTQGFNLRASVLASGSSSRRGWRLWSALALIIALFAVVTVTIISHATPSSPKQSIRTSQAQPVKITPASESIACPTNLAWAPDMSKLAVLGYSSQCLALETPYNTGLSDVAPSLYEGPAGPATAYIATYEATDGARLAAFSPDDEIFQALSDHHLFAPAFTTMLATVNLTPQQYIGIDYTHVVWSSDRTRLYVTFTCYLPDGPPTSPQDGFRWPGHVAQGLLITAPNGQNGQVFLHVSEPQSAGAVVWNLSTGQVVASLTPSSPFTLQPAALAYTWNDSGALLPVSGAASQVTRGAVGAPEMGASTFTVWQPGIVATSVQSLLPGTQKPTTLPVFATGIAALSPNGQYLAASVGLAGLLSPPLSATPSVVPSAATLARYGWQAAPQLPVRDAGLQRAIALASSDGFSGFPGSVSNAASVAWRPDGRLIAVSASTPDHSVSIVDCATGKQVGTLKPPTSQANNTNATVSLIQWSPDGRHLAYFDPSSGTLTLWKSTWAPA